MNHLQEAKANVKLVGVIKESENIIPLMEVTQALALIAIAEQLEVSNKSIYDAKETAFAKGYNLGVKDALREDK